MLRKLRKRLKNQKGLTLIELLAVIVILGIISAIAVPSIGGLISKTKDDAKVAEAIQIINAAKLYVSTHPKTGNLTNTQLGDYLDEIKDTDYTVHVNKNGNKFTYSISGHDACTIVGSGQDPEVTETELQEYTGAKEKSTTTPSTP